LMSSSSSALAWAAPSGVRKFSDIDGLPFRMRSY
jgi:hypothetical protein